MMILYYKGNNPNDAIMMFYNCQMFGIDYSNLSLCSKTFLSSLGTQTQIEVEQLSACCVREGNCLRGN